MICDKCGEYVQGGKCGCRKTFSVNQTVYLGQVEYAVNFEQERLVSLENQLEFVEFSEVLEVAQYLIMARVGKA